MGADAGGAQLGEPRVPGRSQFRRPRSSGEYIVILNNDTQVSPGWLGDSRHLRENADLGLVGAVTNAIGNEAAIEIKYKDGVEMVSASRRYVAGHFRSLMPVQNVAFFAVAFRRDTWDRVGELDERFGLGFFEDDDYCRRVSESGLKIAVAEDVFVHHQLSASFDLLGSARKQEQFERSRKVFEEKWGAWTPHKYRNEFNERALWSGSASSFGTRGTMPPAATWSRPAPSANSSGDKGAKWSSSGSPVRADRVGLGHLVQCGIVARDGTGGGPV